MQEDYPILEKAPVKEAVIDFRVKLVSEFDVKKIDSMHELIKERYPETQEQRISEVRFEPEIEGRVKPLSEKTNGYRYISSDKKQIVQAKMDGFTFSRLHPYIKWEELRNEAHRLWQIYKDITLPESITRVSVRYINNLNIPMPIRDLDDYLTASPIVPEGYLRKFTVF